MAIRVHELAKKLNIPTKELHSAMLQVGFTKTSNFTTLSDEDVEAITQFIKGESPDTTKAIQSREVASTAEHSTGRIRKRVRKVKIEEAPVQEDKEPDPIEDSPAEENNTEPPIEESPVEENNIETPVEEIKEVDSQEASPIISLKKEQEEENKPKPLITLIKRDAVPASPLAEKTEPEKKEVKETPQNKEEEPLLTIIKRDAVPASSLPEKKETLTKTKEKVRTPVVEETESTKPHKKPRKKIQSETKQKWHNPLTLEEEEARVPFAKHHRNKKQHYKTQQAPPKQEKKHVFNERKKAIIIPESISISELASSIGIKAADIIKTLLSLGIMATINQTIDGETAALVASEFSIEIQIQNKSIETVLEQQEDSEEELTTRAPVVTVMGHVDHGKTSLLDKIKKTNITDKESGGITQHIAAYSVHTKFGMITFFDTPGHEAFTAMRARGAEVTDIVILVVAADEGSKPQTAEAIAHAKAADVPIIVALSKCDKDKADVERTMQQLLEYDLTSESYGGDIPMLPISSHTGEGLETLLETIQLQAEILELKANPSRLAEGRVVESRVDPGKGNVATILIQRGSLKIGDSYVAGSIFGRVRTMWNDKAKKITKAGPSEPIEITGLSGLPQAGDSFNVVEDEKNARRIATARAFEQKESMLTKKKQIKLDSLFNNMGQDEKKLLTLIIKVDVIGSQEAFQEAINKLGNDKVGVNIVQSTVGGITQTDVTLAMATESIIIGFNTRPDNDAKRLALQENIEIRLYSVIYEALDDIEKALEGLLEPVIREEIHGKALVKETFKIPKIGMIAGCVVTEGKAIRDASIRVIRDNLVIHSSKIASLKRFKDDVKEVTEGMDCGVSIVSYKDLKVNDILEFFTHIEQKAKL